MDKKDIKNISSIDSSFSFIDIQVKNISDDTGTKDNNANKNNSILNKDNNISKSFSLIDIPFDTAGIENNNCNSNIEHNNCNSNIEHNNNCNSNTEYNSNNIQNPEFMKFRINIPFTFQKLKNIENLGCIYKFYNKNRLEIINIENNDVRTFDVLFYNDILEYSYTTSIAMVFGRKKYEREIEKKENMEYKNSLKNNKKYIKYDKNKEVREQVYKIILEKNINYIFIEDVEELEREIKNIIFHKEEEYVPKIKTYKIEQKKEFFFIMIENIPGLGKTVANAVVEEYKTIKNLIENLNIKILEEMEIKTENKIRKLGEKQAKILFKALNSLDGEQKIN
ncbi:hypothetical protein SLOPH_1214 [Spraguea lophii 42_110]|uniref:Uncharacterized protein n=1 Tax=Spraguea lophii (strain 42_110) TaxID=1358809 RepID=S7W660_SPRLO|nr:hypothetical protein SLOPH_1214 [Spraguea lophii 42_110]